MRCFPRMIQVTFLIAVMVFACLPLTSCGTTCFAGVINNGTGTVLTQTSTVPSVCPFSPGMTTMNVIRARAQACETCTASSQVHHIFVTLRSIQLHSIFPGSPNDSEWLELAPQLLREPRQIDLLDDAAPEILVQGASVPAGTYGELLLQFAPGVNTPASVASLSEENSCGQSRRNCMLMSDGRVEELNFTGTGNSLELRLPLQYNGSSAIALVPGETVDLRLALQPEQVSAVSPSEGWQIHYILVGSVTASR
jgi:hypothetical protein